MEIPYYNQLIEIRELLENELPIFPFLQCQKATKLINKILGLQELGGIYTPKNFPHSWSYDPEKGRYIDLCQDMFDDCSNPITILPVSTNILEPRLNFTKVQKNLTDKKVDELCRIYENRYGRIPILTS